MASIHEQPNSKHLRIALSDASGKRRWLSAGTSDDREAIILANVAELEAEVTRKVTTTAADVQHLEELMQKLFQHLHRNQLYNPTFHEFMTESLKKWYKGDLPVDVQVSHKCICDILGEGVNDRLSYFTPDRCHQVAQELQNEYSYNTVCKRFNFFKRFVKRAKALGIIKTDILHDIEISRKKCKQPRKQDRSGLKDEELVKIYKHIEERIQKRESGEAKENWLSVEQLHEIRGFIIAGENFGPRLNEVCSLRLSNINFETNRITFTSHKTKKENNYKMLPAFRRYAESVKEANGEGDSPLFKIFYVTPGKRTDSIQSAIHNVFIRSGVKTKERPVTYRCLRRRLAREVGSVDPFAARDALNHSSLNTTEIYQVKHQSSVDKATDIMASKSIADGLQVLPPPHGKSNS